MNIVGFFPIPRRGSDNIMKWFIAALTAFMTAGIPVTAQEYSAELMFSDCVDPRLVKITGFSESPGFGKRAYPLNVDDGIVRFTEEIFPPRPDVGGAKAKLGVCMGQSNLFDLYCNVPGVGFMCDVASMAFGALCESEAKALSETLRADKGWLAKNKTDYWFKVEWQEPSWASFSDAPNWESRYVETDVATFPGNTTEVDFRWIPCIAQYQGTAHVVATHKATITQSTPDGGSETWTCERTETSETPGFAMVRRSHSDIILETTSLKFEIETGNLTVASDGTCTLNRFPAPTYWYVGGTANTGIGGFSVTTHEERDPVNGVQMNQVITGRSHENEVAGNLSLAWSQIDTNPRHAFHNEKKTFELIVEASFELGRTEIVYP